MRHCRDLFSTFRLLWAVLCKTSCLVPVPKKVRPSSPKDYRPVALTSHLMKSLERLVLSLLRPLVSSSLDPLQFAYQLRLGVEDSITFLLHCACAHLDRSESTVRIMFMDFSSAFNTVRPALLGSKLTAMQVDPPLVSWITDYLTGLTTVCQTAGRCVLHCGQQYWGSTGNCSFPLSVHPEHLRLSILSDSCHLQKFADDSATVGWVSEGKE